MPAASDFLTVSVTVNAVAPAAPTGVVVTPGNTQLTVTWTAVPAANNGGAVITAYTATATDTTNAALTETCTATGATATGCASPITGLMNNRAYRVTVVATNSVDDSAPSVPVEETPVATLALSVGSIAAQVYEVGTEVTLTLPDGMGGTGTLSYSLTGDIPEGLAFTADNRVLRGTPMTAMDAVILTYTVTDEALPAASDFLTVSVTVNAVAPAAPTGVVVTPGNTQLTVTWTAVPAANNGGAVITAYTATATDTTNAALTETCTATGATATGCASPITGLMNNRAYRVTVVATNSVDDSDPSVPVEETPVATLALSVGSIAAQVYEVGTVVTLTLPDGMGGTGTLSYSLTGDIPEGLAFTADNRVLRGTPMTAMDAVILTYTVTDEALPAASDFLTVSVTVNAVAPAAPTGVVVTPGSGQLTVTWTAVPAANNGGAVITAYTATATDTTNAALTETCTATGATATGCASPITGLMNNRAYRVTVVATNSVDDSAPSVPVEETPVATLALSVGSIAAQVYEVGTVVTLTLPDGMGGTGTLSYSLTGDIPEGLAFTADNRVLRGTPMTAMDAVILTYTVTDEALPAASDFLTVSVTVNAVAPAAPTGVVVTPGNTQLTVTWTAVPAANNGGAVITAYTATATDTTNAALTETCTATGATATGCASPITGLMNNRAYRVTVVATNSVDDSAPSVPVEETPVATLALSVGSIAAQVYEVGTVVTLTLPDGMGGTGTLSYSLTGDIPEGLAFTADNRVLRGTPMTAMDAVILTYTVTDEALPAASDFLTVSVTVNAVAPAAPTGVVVTPGNTQLTVTWTAVPAANNGGAVITAYTATATDTTNAALTETCTATGATATGCASPITGLMNNRAYRVTVVATNSVDDSAPSVPVEETPVATLALSVGSIAAQVYEVGTVVTLTLPDGMGGTGTLSYSLTGDIPEGLAFTADNRVLRGTPMTAMDAVILTYTVTDEALPAASDFLTVSVTVNAVAPAAPTGVVVTPGSGQLTVTWTAVPAANNGGAVITAYTATATDTTNAALTETCTATGATATGCASPITGLMNNRAYRVTVVATNSVDDSDPSVPVEETPVATLALSVGSIAAQVYEVGTVVTLTLPDGMGGTGTLSYSLTGDIPEGLAFTADNRVLRGTPMTAMDAVILTYTVTDEALPAASDFLTVSVTVNAVAPAAPTGVVVTPGNTQLTVTWTAVPAANNGGAVITAYTATATDTTNAALTETCTATGATATGCASPITGLMNNRAYRVTVVATNSVDDSDPSVPVEETPVATLALSVGSIAAQVYEVGTVVTLTLPDGMGGTGTLSYSLTGDIPEGLAFTADNRVLRGTPMTAMDAVILTYTVTDEALPAASDFLTVSVTVNAVAPAAPTGVVVTPRQYATDRHLDRRAGGEQRRRRHHRLHRHGHRHHERRPHRDLHRHRRHRHGLRQPHHRPDEQPGLPRDRGGHQQCGRQRPVRARRGDAGGDARVERREHCGPGLRGGHGGHPDPAGWHGRHRHVELQSDRGHSGGAGRSPPTTGSSAARR